MDNKRSVLYWRLGCAGLFILGMTLWGFLLYMMTRPT